MNYVILGAGPAGVMAAETIRQVDKTGNITLIGGEPEPPYSRMALPYLLAGNIEEHGTYLRQHDRHYDQQAIIYMTGRAGGIDTANKKLYLSAGQILPFDRLLIATGASPIIPRMDGANLDGVHTCWTLEDARSMLKLASKGAPVVLVGAGFIGCIVLEALHKMGCDITVVEIAPRMVARMLDETAGNMLGRWCQAKGIKLVANTKVERITGGSGAGGADLFVGLSNGTAIPARLVVLAAGVKSNTGFLEGSGIKVNWGVVVDEFMETTAPGSTRRATAARPSTCPPASRTCWPSSR
jgi:NAD(P)H-nitrite reductase